MPLNKKICPYNKYLRFPIHKFAQAEKSTPKQNSPQNKDLWDFLSISKSNARLFVSYLKRGKAFCHLIKNEADSTSIVARLLTSMWRGFFQVLKSS